MIFIKTFIKKCLKIFHHLSKKTPLYIILFMMDFFLVLHAQINNYNMLHLFADDITVTHLYIFIFSCLKYNLFILEYNSCKVVIQTWKFYITIDCEWIFKRFSNCSSIKYICRIKLHTTVLCHWIYQYTHYVTGVLFSVRKINIEHEIGLYYWYFT